MSESEKPKGDLKEAEGVTVDSEGNLEVNMETIELSEPQENSDED